MNKYVKKVIEGDDLANDLDDNLGSQFVRNIEITEDYEKQEEVLIFEVSAEYNKKTNGECIDVDVQVVVTEKEIIESDDPITLIKNLLVKEYNGMIAKILEEDMNDAKKEYENFKC